MAGSNGSTTPKTERELLTEIMLLPRNLTEELQQNPLSHARHSADVPNRGGRILPGAELTSSKDARLQGGVVFRARKAVPSQVWTGEAARCVTLAAVEVPAAKACPVAAASVVAVAVAAVAAVEGGSHANI